MASFIEDMGLYVSCMGYVAIFLLLQKARVLIPSGGPAWANAWECIGRTIVCMTEVEGRYSEVRPKG